MASEDKRLEEVWMNDKDSQAIFERLRKDMGYENLDPLGPIASRMWGIVIDLRNHPDRYNGTLELYKKMVAKREEYKLDTILETPWSEIYPESCSPAKVYEMCPWSMHGRDKRGYPIAWDGLGVMQMKDLVAYQKNPWGKEAMGIWMLRNQEKMARVKLAISRKDKSLCLRHVAVIDLKNVALSNVMTIKSWLQSTIDLAQFTFPGTVDKIFMINTSLFFRAIWTIVKPFVDPVTTQKISILGYKFKTSLNEFGIPDSEIPTDYGGKGSKLVDGEDNIVKIDPKLPSSFLATAEVEKSKNDASDKMIDGDEKMSLESEDNKQSPESIVSGGADKIEQTMKDVPDPSSQALSTK